MRADAQRNVGQLLEAAKAVFAESGVDAPVREIAARAGVGVGTLYRHFPQRSDLITAVFKSEVDAAAAEAPRLSAEHEPIEALLQWLMRFTGFIATKGGLAAALHSGDPAYEPLPRYFEANFGPVVHSLLEAAEATGQIRAGAVEPVDLLRAVANLSLAGDEEHTRRMVRLLIDGLRFSSAR
ncbi:TetR/AcrR family transcriptional regulator [Kineosporia rhizophila]|uniref:TetR/AcrR family transcriptional regulator n=1 Tax=Kineosporia TaxID=49184 RepID=UPI001E2D4EEA|nr:MULTISPECIES: TetR/AcrR family transcriptional regulator [Kineosporia]MCE0537525.1 TetR/AcrR family transcriptional regulator [Kineosporia rhizophila]GLY18972.1 TetR family transcriptional regulator [Kineosporia sp. NBRC 101677]